jgi:hypothetical protein
MKRPLLCALALLLVAAAPGQHSVAFADLAQLVRAHPLYGVLRQYDREIAALRSTMNVTAASGPAESRHVAPPRIPVAAVAAPDGARERRATNAALAPQSGDDELGAFSHDVTRETDASLAAYRTALATRVDRAYAARAQQLREKELTRAFDVEREDAGQRLSLRLKLADLHLTAPTRSRLAAKLAALDARERDAVAAVRRSDAAILAAYRTQVERAAAAAEAAMATELREKGGANVAIRRNVAQAASGPHTALPNLRSQAAAFERDGRVQSGDADVHGAMAAASASIATRFAQLRAADSQSTREISAQIAQLRQARAALYRRIVDEIRQDARAAAQERHVASVRFDAPRSAGSLDLTAVVRKELAGR